LDAASRTTFTTLSADNARLTREIDDLTHDIERRVGILGDMATSNKTQSNKIAQLTRAWSTVEAIDAKSTAYHFKTPDAG